MGSWDISCPQQTATSFSKENYCILFRGVSRETCNMVDYWKRQISYSNPTLGNMSGWMMMMTMNKISKSQVFWFIML
jgi:hypothetical protein